MGNGCKVNYILGRNGDGVRNATRWMRRRERKRKERSTMKRREGKMNCLGKPGSNMRHK